MFTLYKKVCSPILRSTLKKREWRSFQLSKSLTNTKSPCGDDFITFESMVEIRRDQARRTVVVEVAKSCNLEALQKFCSTYGSLLNIFSYAPSAKCKMIMIEFSEESSVRELLKNACYKGISNNGLTIQLPFLKLSNSLKSFPLDTEDEPVCLQEIHQENVSDDGGSLVDQMLCCDNMSDQIQRYYDRMKMTELGWRMRFITCLKIEWLLPRLLMHHAVLPFGSSVNTFGNHNCDLDVVVDFDSESSSAKSFPLSIQSLHSDASNDRSSVQRNIELFADIMKRFMPGFHSITRILHAKVPIIKCNEKFTGLEVDISIGNRSGFYMSQYLYMLGCCDPRVRPLVFAVRYWAKERRLTDKRQPGRYISNFSLSLMVLFYLMQTTPPVLPSLKQYSDKGNKPSQMDFNSVPPSENSQSLTELLKGYFDYYAEFDYRKDAISLMSGKKYTKPDYSALYIENPVDLHLNVSKNINLEEIERIRGEHLKAFSMFDNVVENIDEASSLWGLPGLALYDKGKTAHFQNMSTSLDLKTMFDFQGDLPPRAERISQLRSAVEATTQKLFNSTKGNLAATAFKKIMSETSKKRPVESENVKFYQELKKNEKSKISKKQRSSRNKAYSNR